MAPLLSDWGIEMGVMERFLYVLEMDQWENVRWSLVYLAELLRVTFDQGSMDF